MTLNKKCFYNSLKKDYTEIAKIVLVCIGVAAGSFIGYVFQDFIKSIPASAILASVLTLLTMVILYDTATNSRCRGMDAVTTIGKSIIILCIIFFVGLFVYSMIIIREPAVTSNYLMVSLLKEIMPVLVILTITMTTLIPISLAYVKCNNQPESEVQNAIQETDN
jgi:uncharacterized membrane protein YfcA